MLDARAALSPRLPDAERSSAPDDALDISRHSSIANDNSVRELGAPTVGPSTILHIVLGLTAIASAYAVDAFQYRITTIVGSIIYISWFGRRTAGLVIACGIGFFEMLSRFQPPELSLGGAAWGIAYVLLAWIVSSVERATRPSPS